MKNKLIILTLIIALIAPIKPLFSMKQEKPIYEVLAEKKARESIREHCEKILKLVKEYKELRKKYPNSENFDMYFRLKGNSYKKALKMEQESNANLFLELEKIEKIDREQFIAEYAEKHKKQYEENKNLYIKHYKDYESDINNNKKDMQSNPARILYGGLDYFMSLEEMKKAVIEKFKKMKESGLIIDRTTFEKNKNKYYTNRPYPTNALERIFCSEYIEEMISRNKSLENYSTPKYVIVYEKTPEDIGVTINMSQIPYPIIVSLLDAQIYATKIEGEYVGTRDTNMELINKVHYVDLGEQEKKKQNIIRDKISGKDFIIDTGLNSFDIGSIIINEPSNDYYRKKFNLINNITEKDKYGELKFDVYPFRK